MNFRFRNIEYMYYMVLSWKLKGTDREMRARFRAMEEKRDTCILGLVDGFLESAMQLLLQLYLAFYHSLPASFLRSMFLYINYPDKSIERAVVLHCVSGHVFCTIFTLLHLLSCCSTCFVACFQRISYFAIEQHLKLLVFNNLQIIIQRKYEIVPNTLFSM